VALLAHLDGGARFELYRRRILYAVLVPAGARLGVVRGVLRGIFGLNVISTRFFAEGEFWFSLIKVITIIAFIILGGAAIFGFIPMQDGSPAPGLTTSPPKAGSHMAVCRS
jgi:amino acid permease